MADETVGPALNHLDRQDPAGVLGVYLYGSATTGGLRRDSDIGPADGYPPVAHG